MCLFDDEFKKLTRIVEGLFTLSMADAVQYTLYCEPLYHQRSAGRKHARW